MLFTPSLDELIHEDDLARIVVDAVDQFDLSAIDPAVMLATLIYAYANKVLSWRQVEILCLKRVEFRWISGQTMRTTPPSPGSATDTARCSRICSPRCWTW